MPTSDPVTFYQLIAQELSVSGSFPINASTDDHPQPNKSPREALAGIYWKTNAVLDLRGTDGPSTRPFAPSVGDDLTGHVLSLRAENLQVMALVSALISALASAKVIGQVDQVGILASVKGQF